jgi:hypothetical protein
MKMVIDFGERGFIEGDSHDRYLGKQPIDHEKECMRGATIANNIGWTDK